MLYEVFFLGSLWFWLALIIPTIALLAFVEHLKYGPASIVALLTIAAFIAFGEKGWTEWVLHNPETILKYVGLYLLIGVVWSFARWFFYSWSLLDIYTTTRSEYVEYLGDRPFEKDAFRSRLNSKGYGSNSFPPKVNDHKADVIFWMAYWPFSAAWTIISNPVVRLYNLLYRLFGKLYQASSDVMFAKYKNDL